MISGVRSIWNGFDVDLGLCRSLPKLVLEIGITQCPMTLSIVWSVDKSLDSDLFCGDPAIENNYKRWSENA